MARSIKNTNTPTESPGGIQLLIHIVLVLVSHALPPKSCLLIILFSQTHPRLFVLCLHALSYFASYFTYGSFG